MRDLPTTKSGKVFPKGREYDKTAGDRWCYYSKDQKNYLTEKDRESLEKDGYFELDKEGKYYAYLSCLGWTKYGKKERHVSGGCLSDDEAWGPKERVYFNWPGP